MTLRIIIIYKDTSYKSDPLVLDKQEEATVREIIVKAIEGKTTYLKMSINKTDTYFPKAILAESIIKIEEL